MKKLILLSAAAIILHGCSKQESNGGTNSSSLSLNADQTTLSLNGTTKITATVSNLQSCCTMMYTWSVNAGNISENGAEATFTAPANSSQCTITCSAKDNCGKISQTKSLLITVRQ